MTCNSNCYLPIPPRAWSRVQNSCSLFDNFQDNGQVQLPYSGKLVPASTLYLEYAMLNKGNVLQYKKNSSSLTKQQRYAQIAKGMWTNRNTTWATQSTRGYTNPNNQSLQRVNNINITLAGVPTTAPVTCPKPVTPVNDILPPASSGGSANPETLPPPPPPPTGNSGTALPYTVPEPVPQPIVIQDLGNLVCGTEENICTGEVIRQPTDIICHPTSDSDVPGPLMELCWNDGNPTWYPRQRYVMTNSANKWPTNATLLSAVKANDPPFLTLVSNLTSSVTLSWTIGSTCLPISGFNIYQNYGLIAVVKYPTNTITINGLMSDTLYVFSVSSFSDTSPTKTYSEFSNFVSNSSTLFSTTGNPIQYVQGNQYVIEFIQNGTITFNFVFLINFACCGGGGGGGGGAYFTGGGGGGGGGGGIITGNLTSVISNTYNITVGSGGAGGAAGLPSNPNPYADDGLPGINGSNSSLDAFVALGGQGGQGGKSATSLGGNGGASGTPGSSGGAGESAGNAPAQKGILGGGGGGGDYFGTSNAADGSQNISVISSAPLNAPFGAGGGGGGSNENAYSGIGGNAYAGDGGMPGQNGATNKGGGGGGGRAGDYGLVNPFILSYPGGNGGSGIVLLYLQI
jgi:hypothetical protein